MNGRYHLFYQKNPNGPYWQQIHWGHMASDDLRSWVEQPIALAPEPGIDRAGAWSGGAVVANGAPTLIYTPVDGAKARVGLATSDASMRAWRKVPENPVIDGKPEGVDEIRDPFVWGEDGAWNLLIGSGVAAEGGKALLYTSPDLRTFRYEGPAFEGDRATSGIFWEMPTLIDLGDKHALLVTTVEEGAPARGLYWLGRWDGRRFVPDHPEPKRQELLDGMLSPTVARDAAGRLVAIGIVPETRGSVEQRAAGWAHTFDLPRVLSLCKGGEAMCQRAAPELSALRGEHRRVASLALGPETVLPPAFAGDQIEILAELEPNGAEVGLEVLRSPDGAERTRLAFDPSRGRFAHDGREVDLPLAAGEPLRLHVFVDHSVMDVFVNERFAYSARVYPSRPDSLGVRAFASAGGAGRLRSLDLWEVRAP